MLKLFRFFRNFDSYTYGNDFRGEGAITYQKFFKIYEVYQNLHICALSYNFPPKFCSTHLKEAMSAPQFTYWPGGGGLEFARSYRL